MKESHATRVTKIPKTKRRKYGMNETHISNQCPELKILKISKGDSNIIWVARRRTFPLHYVAIKNDVFIFSEIATLDLENTG